jgi:hypothetical protein
MRTIALTPFHSWTRSLTQLALASTTSWASGLVRFQLTSVGFYLPIGFYLQLPVLSMLFSSYATAGCVTSTPPVTGFYVFYTSSLCAGRESGMHTSPSLFKSRGEKCIPHHYRCLAKTPHDWEHNVQPCHQYRPFQVVACGRCQPIWSFWL